MTILNLLMISAIVCFIVDVSGIIDTLKKALWKKYVKVGDWKNMSLKPLSCSLCMTWWTTLIYIIATGHFTIPYIALCALLSLVSSNITDCLQLIKDILTYIVTWIYRLLGI